MHERDTPFGRPLVRPPFKLWFSVFCLAALTSVTPAALPAQTFQPIPSLSFIKGYAGADPLPQLISIASTGSNFNYSAVATSSTGGDWLTITNNNSCCYSTPRAINVSANPAVTLAAGSYTAQITVKAQSGSTTIVIPVALTIKASGSNFFDALPGGFTFSMITDGSAPPGQPLQIRNAGTGSLPWTASAATSDGGTWLKLSSSSGTAPSAPTVSIDPSKLPGTGLTAGTFTGQVVLQSSGDRVTVPVTVSVGSSVFSQVNPLNFNKVYAGADPLSQVITVASTGSNFNYVAMGISSTGGDWLTISNNNSCCYSTPRAVTVTVSPSVTLAVGTYSAEIIVKSQDYTKSMVIPVTLTIEDPGSTFFDALPGEMTFSMVTAGAAPPGQPLPIRNAGTGSLSWTASTTTSDGGDWLKLSSSSGTAPSTPTVSVDPSKLPGTGLTAGTFTGQVVLQRSGDRVTIPVTVSVGSSVFSQINPLSFNKVYAGANPLPQVVSIASTGSNFSYVAVGLSSTGGDWLSITNDNSCCYSTPRAITVTVNPSITLAEGTYSAEIVVKSQDYTKGMVIPVTLTIESPGSTFFDALPGEMTFSMITAGAAPPGQPLQIRNGGTGSLSWTASTTTSDGGAWLKLSSSSGTAPSAPTVSVDPSKLPGTGLTAGTFTGQVVLQSSGDRVTVPVTVSVGSSVFSQINPLNFNKVYAGANPLPQVISIASTGSNFNYVAVALSSTGGNWLSVTNDNSCCYSTPRAITVTVNPSITLAEGTYSAEIVVKSQDYTQGMVIPVTLTIESPGSPYLDTMPGGLTFSMTPGGSTPPSQPLQIRNAGTGTLSWTASTVTADAGAWLKLSSTSGTAPSNRTVSIDASKLPGTGLTAGTFSGQVIVVEPSGNRVTLPVTVFVGTAVFVPVSQLSFTKPYQGANPPTQSFTISSAGANFNQVAVAANSTGGNWLSITNNNSCCYSTPKLVTATVNPAVTLSAGLYLAEIIVKSQDYSQSMIIPVALTIAGTTPAAKPDFTPPGGTYSSAQTVIISDSTPGSAIYYTIDGSTPTTSSPTYSKPIQVSTTETIKAVAVAAGYPQSATANAVYTIGSSKAATPDVSQTVSISDATPGATIYYTTDGSTPTTSSRKYAGTLILTSGSILKFIAVAPGYTNSAVRTVTTTVQ